MDISHTIRTTRRAQQLTTRDLAEKAGCTPQAISNYEVGKSQAINPTALAILDALGLEVIIQPKADQQQTGGAA